MRAPQNCARVLSPAFYFLQEHKPGAGNAARVLYDRDIFNLVNAVTLVTFSRYPGTTIVQVRCDDVKMLCRWISAQKMSRCRPSGFMTFCV